MQIDLLEGDYHQLFLSRPHNGAEADISFSQAFLLNQTANTANWAHALRELRSSYSSFSDHFLKYIKHPEYLNAGSLDPLADDIDVRPCSLFWP